MRLNLYRTLLISYLFAVALVGTAAAVNVEKLQIHLDTANGTMYFLEKGWFSNTKYQLKFFSGAWRWQSQDGKWHSLLTPYITVWNKNYHLILDRGGKIIVSKKDNSNHFEVRLIEGTWYENGGGEWLPLDDLYGD